MTTFASNGVLPISLTVQGNLLYVLNAGSSSITGFAIDGASVAARGLDAAAARHQPGADRVLAARLAARRDGEGRDARHLRSARTAMRAGRLEPVGRRRHRSDSLRPAWPRIRLGGGRLGLVVHGRRLRRARDQRRRDAPGRTVLARRDEERPLRLHGERGRGHDLGLLDRADGRSRCSIRPARPALGAGSHPLDEAVRATAASCTCSSTASTRSPAPDRGRLAVPLGEVGTLPAGAVGLGLLRSGARPRPAG